MYILFFLFNFPFASLTDYLQLDGVIKILLIFHTASLVETFFDFNIFYSFLIGTSEFLS